MALLELCAGGLDLPHHSRVVAVPDELVDHFTLAVQEDDRRERRCPVLPGDVRVVVRIDCDENKVRSYCLFEFFSTENFSL